MKLILLVELDLMGFLHPVDAFDLLDELLLASLELLLEQGDLILTLVAQAHQLVIQILNLHLKILLHFLLLLLLVSNLTLEVKLEFSLPLRRLVLHITDSALEALLFRIIEPLQLGKFGLGVCIDFGDSILLITLLLFQELILLPDLVVKTFDSILELLALVLELFLTQ